jgi:epoxyqueuosine reductase
MSLEQEIKDKALGLGFDAVGITDVSVIGPGHVEHFEAWLRSGYAGRMGYMHRNFNKRINPARLRKGTRSVIVVALNYKPHATHHDSGTGRVALYAQYEDYHLFIKALLRELAGFLCVKTGRQDRFKVCVDSAPLAEKALAVRAGLGFIGKNHLLIHPRFGPQILLGELVTTLDLHADAPFEGACRGCNRCMKACPTGALRADGFLDARRCISYLTQYGSQDEPARDTGGWLFGCDECLLACPFSHSAPARANQRFRHYPERAALDLRELLNLTADAFEARFHDSPIRKPGLEALQRNAQLCLRNQGPGT